MHAPVVWMALLLGLIASRPALAVVLAWDASAGAEGYRVHYGEASGAYTVVLDVGASTQASIGGLSPGVTYYVAATAYNASGASGYSNEVTWLEPLPPPPPPTDTTPPQVAITAPLSGATVARKALIRIACEASDDVGVSRVEVLINTTLLCADGASPYSCDWRVPAPGGRTYQIQARAFDAAGHVGWSPLINVTAR